MNNENSTGRCRHGIRFPWECKECADIAWGNNYGNHKAAISADDQLIANLHEAATQLIERWDRPSFQDAPAIAMYIAALREAVNDMTLAAISARELPQNVKPDLWAVLDTDGYPEFCCDTSQACHEHINDALEIGIEEASKWIVRPFLLFSPQQIASSTQQKDIVAVDHEGQPVFAQPAATPAEPTIPIGRYWPSPFGYFACWNCAHTYADHIKTDDAVLCPSPTKESGL